MRNHPSENCVLECSPEISRFKAATSPAQAVLRGLAGLIEGQRCFAEDFGLSMEAVFPRVAEALNGRDAGQVVKAWMCSQEEGARKLQLLMEDLMQHQLSLIAALDDLGSEMVAEFSPADLKRQSPGLLGVRPFAWRTFCVKHRELGENDFLRQHKIVFPGFVKGYVKARKSGPS